jgi:hypothetical protein
MDRIQATNELAFRVAFSGHSGHLRVEPLSTVERTNPVKSLPDFILVSYFFNYLHAVNFLPFFPVAFGALFFSPFNLNSGFCRLGFGVSCFFSFLVDFSTT